MYFSYFLTCLVCIQLYCLYLKKILTQINCRVRKRGIRKYICNERNPSSTKQGRSSSQKQVETQESKAANITREKGDCSELLGRGTSWPQRQCHLTRPWHTSTQWLPLLSTGFLLLYNLMCMYLGVALVLTLSSFTTSITWWLSLSLFAQILQRKNLNGPHMG